MSVQYPVRDRAEWIMRLLYAPDSYDRTNTPLYGRTRMMKACFLLARNLEDKLGQQTGFNFQPDKYGPFDRGVYDAIDLLRNEGKLEVTPPEEHDERFESKEYRLTDEGLEEAENLYESIPERQQELVRWVKNKHAMEKLGQLLNYVYSKYPEMTTESELV